MKLFVMYGNNRITVGANEFLRHNRVPCKIVVAADTISEAMSIALTEHPNFTYDGAYQYFESVHSVLFETETT
jgi:hypothetical protein